MAEGDTPKPKATKSKSSDSSDEVAAAGAQEVQEAFDEATEKGHFGEKATGIPNSEWSVASGPDSPTVEEVREDFYGREGYGKVK